MAALEGAVSNANALTVLRWGEYAVMRRVRLYVQGLGTYIACRKISNAWLTAYANPYAREYVLTTSQPEREPAETLTRWQHPPCEFRRWVMQLSGVT